MRIPANQQWSSVQNGNLFGSVIQTKGIDFNRDGYLSLARKAMALYSAEQDATFGPIIALAADDTNLSIITISGVFQMQLTSDSLPVTKLTSTNAPDVNLQSDAVYFNGLLTVSGATKICTYTGGAWTQRITGLSNSYPHPLCVSEHQNYLAVGLGNTMPLYDTSYSLITTLVVDPQFIFTCIRWRINTIFGGTRNIQGGEAKVFLWNGAGAAAQQGYPVGADWVYSMCAYISTVAIITSLGQLMQYNGGGFSELANLPVYYTPYSWSSDASAASLRGRVISRGMQARGTRIYINIDGTLRQPSRQYPGISLPNQPSGLWCYDPKVGLSHKAGFSTKSRLTLSATDLASGNLVFATPHQALTGDAVLCSALSGLSGLTSGEIYFAIVDGPNNLALALSPADALNGNKITSITGVPAAGDTFEFDRYESTGETIANNIGPVLAFGSRQPNGFYGSEVFFAAEAFKEDMTANSIIMSLGMGRGRGYFIMPKIVSSQIQDAFEKLVAFFDPQWLVSDQIVIKYRLREKFGLPTPLTTSSFPVWTSTTTFTVDPQKKAVSALSVGDEIEIVEGAGAGYLVHLTAIDRTVTPNVFTIDEALPVSNGNTFDFFGMNWKKWKTVANTTTVGGAISKNNTHGFAEMSLGKNASWLELKIELRGFARSIRAFDLVNSISRGD